MLTEHLLKDRRLLHARGVHVAASWSSQKQSWCSDVRERRRVEVWRKGGRAQTSRWVGLAAPFDAWTQLRLNPEPKPDFLADYRSQ